MSEFAERIRAHSRQSSNDLASTIDEDAEQRQLVSARNEHKRDEISRTIFARGMWAIMILILGTIAASIFTIGYHFVMPRNLHWLEGSMVQEIKNFLLSGAIVGLGTNYIRRYLNRS